MIVRKVGDALGATPAALLSGNQDVERTFTWKDLPAADGLDWLSTRRRSTTDATFTEIRIGFDAKGLAALELIDAFGQKSVVRFTNVRAQSEARAGSASGSRRRRAPTSSATSK